MDVSASNSGVSKRSMLNRPSMGRSWLQSDRVTGPISHLRRIDRDGRRELIHFQVYDGLARSLVRRLGNLGIRQCDAHWFTWSMFQILGPIRLHDFLKGLPTAMHLRGQVPTGSPATLSSSVAPSRD